ncbi:MULTISPECIES: sodium:proton antiporter [unclassified Hyphomicrobium]|uniref:cation:proton antiporter n=1 Tax=unclassified Hyphomicrobium TaxID=2619925 RepID=UPI000213F7ED|nr:MULTISPECIES: cation:proton antiporter [unclassified Hyphomicrobium]CCB63329.1 putative Sodium/hydrogen exchanger [Hyphomicrobium sp. MC1]
MSAFDIGAIILILATVVGIINERYFRIPSVIAQLLGSLLLSLLVLLASHTIENFHIAALIEERIGGAHLPRVLLDGLLALLLFASSLHANLRDLRINAVAVFSLATLGVMLSTAIFTFSFWGVLHLWGMAIPLAWCFLLGAILAPTDAIAVEGLLKSAPLPPSLKSTIVGESLFNDGTAIVLFLSALAVIAGDRNVFGHGRFLSAMLVEGGGGILLGLVTGFLVSWLMTVIKDDEIAIIASLALALGTYRLATSMGLSGPLAVVICGIVLANRPMSKIDDDERQRKIRVFWSLVDSVLNVLLFVLLGFEILAMTVSQFAIVSAATAIPLAFLSRFLSVGLPPWLLRRNTKEPLKTPFLLTWIGLRGAISVALVQIAPQGPYTDDLIAACYAVVIFTIVVQGLLAPRVIAALYGTPPDGKGEAVKSS